MTRFIGGGGIRVDDDKRPVRYPYASRAPCNSTSGVLSVSFVLKEAEVVLKHEDRARIHGPRLDFAV
jgi:hypothetical protein